MGAASCASRSTILDLGSTFKAIVATELARRDSWELRVHERMETRWSYLRKNAVDQKEVSICDHCHNLEVVNICVEKGTQELRTFYTYEKGLCTQHRPEAVPRQSLQRLRALLTQPAADVDIACRSKMAVLCTAFIV